MLLYRLAIISIICANLAYSTQKRIVTTVEVEPFYQRVGDRYEGFVVDLTEAIAKKAGFEYEFRLVADGSYGTLVNETSGKWTGMMGEILTGKADLAIAPLTIAPKREMYADFTPFMDVGISILMLKPSLVRPPIMSFLEPLSCGVWVSIFSAYLAISFVLYVIARFSPCENFGEVAEAGPSAALTIKWRSISGRIAGLVWWFMTFIIFAWYTANLAASLTVQRAAAPIFTVDDLAKQNLVKYGCLRTGTTGMTGTTAQFFEMSTNPTYQRMWSVMSSDPSNMPRDYDDAKMKIRNSHGKYAALLESSVTNFISSRQPCDTYKVGQNIDAKSYGIATPKTSNLKAAISQAVKELNETGELKKMKNKWWGEKNECEGSINPYEPQGETMTLHHLAGAFVAFLVGLVIAFLVLLIEILIQAKQDAKTQNITLREAIKKRAKCGRPEQQV